MNHFFSGAIVFSVSFFAASAGARILIPVLRKRKIFDIPNDRSSHGVPTLRGGGIAILAGLALGILVAFWKGMPLLEAEFLIYLAGIAAIGLRDDWGGGFSVRLRLLFQFLIAAIVVYRWGGLAYLPLPAPFDVPLHFLAVPAALLWILAVTNIYNFLDGIDGLAAVQGVIAGLGLAFLEPQGAFMAVGLALAGACAGFLPYNWHPAKIFMGDTGSSTLGFLFAVLPFHLNSSQRSHFVWIIAILLCFFLSDGCLTLLRRLFRGEKIWRAHRSHLYQRLVQSGLRHDQAVVKIMSGSVFLTVTLVAALAYVSPSYLSRVEWFISTLAIGGFFIYKSYAEKKERRLAEVKSHSQAGVA